MGGMSAEETAPTMQEIPVEECHRLLTTQEIGRLAVNAEHHPLVFPVNYAMDGTTVVIRTAPGTKLAAADHANVTFEVDEIDRRTRSGWSVLVRAVAEEVGPGHRADLVARTEAGRLGVTTYLVPPLVVLLSWLLLDEVPPALAVVGGVVCLAGVAVSRRRSPSPRPPAPVAAQR